MVATDAHRRTLRLSNQRAARDQSEAGQRDRGACYLRHHEAAVFCLLLLEGCVRGNEARWMETV